MLPSGRAVDRSTRWGWSEDGVCRPLVTSHQSLFIAGFDFCRSLHCNPRDAARETRLKLVDRYPGEVHMFVSQDCQQEHHQHQSSLVVAVRR